MDNVHEKLIQKINTNCQKKTKQKKIEQSRFLALPLAFVPESTLIYTATYSTFPFKWLIHLSNRIYLNWILDLSHSPKSSSICSLSILVNSNSILLLPQTKNVGVILILLFYSHPYWAIRKSYWLYLQNIIQNQTSHHFHLMKLLALFLLWIPAKMDLHFLKYVTCIPSPLG